MNFFKKLFGAAKKPETEAALPTPVDPVETPADAANTAARIASEACLDRHWQAVGTVERDVLTYMISPSFTGGPHWPSTRQAYRVVRRDGAIILATEGLSDPFDDAEGLGNGFEMELFLETADIPNDARGELGDVDPLRRSWAFELIEHVAKTVANAGGITHQLDNHGVLSLELPGFSLSHQMSEQVPKLFVTDDDAAGVLLGGPEPDFPTRLEDMPLSPVRLVPVVLITASELEYVRSGGRAAREDLVERLKAAGVGHTSSLYRASVV
ncbi:suppressor of fused domain protein [Pseudomonas sp. O64]|uniref:suppressor of fused domain protein n=1 Tax=unclassified Pseudomonas TaxID=196821 RepID=UPI001F58099E|nr:MULTISPECIES: suppressor of fused domain protein [unclassified Pseudomonas]UNM17391.1 suppressor of fused domain protein [Pseudomonas sp. ArH3a]UXZ20182.1 suppressor of fused domain protein [Pseudomonas sp. YeP6b]